MALEVLPGKGVGRAYAKVIDDASAESLRTLFDEHISKEAEVITDEWNGYLPIKGYPNLTSMLFPHDTKATATAIINKIFFIIYSSLFVFLFFHQSFIYPNTKHNAGTNDNIRATSI